MPDAIADDYALSEQRLRARYADRDEEDQAPMLNAFLAERGLTARAALLAVLDGLDLEAHLRAGGLADDDLSALRRRALGAAPAPR